MNVMLCKCTGTEYLAMLASENSLDCCKHKLEEAQKSVKTKDCCSKKTKDCSKKAEQQHFSIDEDCCSSNYKYAKANINFDLAVDVDLPSFDLFPLFELYFYSDFNYSNELRLVHTPQSPQNKAPPRFYGIHLLHWIQNYRC